MKLVPLLCSLLLYTSYADSTTTVNIAVHRIRSNCLTVDVANALTDQLENTILKYPDFHVIIRTNLEALLTESNLEETGLFTNDTTNGRKTMLSSVDKICIGSVSCMGTRYQFSLKLVAVKSGRIEAAIQEKCSSLIVDTLSAVLERMVKQLFHNRINGFPSPTQTQEANIPEPSDIQLSPAASNTGYFPAQSAQNPDSTETSTHPASGRNTPNTASDTILSNEQHSSIMAHRIGIGAAVIFATLTTLILLVNHK